MQEQLRSAFRIPADRPVVASEYIKLRGLSKTKRQILYMQMAEAIETDKAYVEECVAACHGLEPTGDKLWVKRHYTRGKVAIGSIRESKRVMNLLDQIEEDVNNEA
jgi:hypothetical protein